MTGSPDAPALRILFEELADELTERGARADVFLVGGAAMAIAYDRDRLTRDVDAIFVPTDVVRAAAAAVGGRRGLREDWLNDAVKGFLHGPDPDATTFFESDSLRVDVASPQYLLAMKLLASRSGADIDDIRRLYRLCGFTTVEEGLDLLASAYPPGRIEDRTQFVLAEIVDSLDDE